MARIDKQSQQDCRMRSQRTKSGDLLCTSNGIAKKEMKKTPFITLKKMNQGINVTKKWDFYKKKKKKLRSSEELNGRRCGK